MVLVSCEKAKFPSEYSRRLLGVWEWERSNLVSKYLDDTPATTGETRQLEFKENGKYLEFVNEKRVLKGDYYIVSEQQGQLISINLEHSDASYISLFINPNDDGKLHMHRFHKTGVDSDLLIFTRRE